MAIIQCRECHKEASDEANVCPHCGAPFPAKKEYRGKGFEWKSKLTVYGFPLVHIAVGKDAKGKLRVAKGIIAIGQFGIGLITIAQFGIGVIFGLGQFIFGLTTIAQFAIGILFGLGQFATGYIAIGQVTLGWYALCQMGLARYIWTPKIRNPEAIEFFRQLLEKFKHIFH